MDKSKILFVSGDREEMAFIRKKELTINKLFELIPELFEEVKNIKVKDVFELYAGEIRLTKDETIYDILEKNKFKIEMCEHIKRKYTDLFVKRKRVKKEN